MRVSNEEARNSKRHLKWKRGVEAVEAKFRFFWFHHKGQYESHSGFRGLGVNLIVIISAPRDCECQFQVAEKGRQSVCKAIQ